MYCTVNRILDYPNLKDNSNNEIQKKHWTVKHKIDNGVTKKESNFSSSYKNFTVTL